MKKKILLITIPILIVIGIVLFFILKEDTYKVTFNTNGGTNIKQIKAEPNEELTLPECTKEGYLFDGWYLNNELIKSPYIVTKDITLEAKWHKIPSLPFEVEEELYKKGQLYSDIDSSTLTQMEDDKKSFVLFVYSPGCTACAAFREVLTEFVSKNKLSIYVMPTPEMKKTNIYNYVTYAPTIVIFKDGEIVSYLDAVSDEDMKYYESSDNFKEWLTKYIVLK